VFKSTATRVLCEEYQFRLAVKLPVGILVPLFGVVAVYTVRIGKAVGLSTEYSVCLIILSLTRWCMAQELQQKELAILRRPEAGVASRRPKYLLGYSTLKIVSTNYDDGDDYLSLGILMIIIIITFQILLLLLLTN
jgi:hypothetical protein